MKRIATAMCLCFVAATAGAQTLTTYYNFEGNFNDFPGAGVAADDLTLVGTGGGIVADPAVNGTNFAKGSTMSYQFINNGSSASQAETNAWSADLTSGNQYTIAYWFKGDDDVQENNNTRLATVRNTAPNATLGPDVGWQIEGFGQQNPIGLMDLRIQGGVPGNFFSNDAVGVLSGVNNDANTANDEWHHVAFVVSNTGSAANNLAFIETFVDGVSLGQSENSPATGTMSLANLDGELIIGGQAGNGRDTTGFLDDFALFEGILSDADIAGLADGILSPTDFLPAVAPVPEPASIAIWTMIGIGLFGYGLRRYRTRS